MADDLTALPLKSLELPSKTVSKLKPLGIKTVGDLYALEPAALVAAGLVLRELEEIAEAAADFGVTWRSKAACAAALGVKPTPPKPAPKPRAPLSTAVARIALPDEVSDAFAADSRATPPITDADLDYFAPYVDETRRHFKDAPFSPRHFRLVRRMALVRSHDLEHDVRTYFVALIDISTFPLHRTSEIETFALHVTHLVNQVLDRIAIKRVSTSVFASCASSTGIPAKDEPRANALIAAHARWIAGGPPFLSPVPPALAPLTTQGLSMLDSDLR